MLWIPLPPEAKSAIETQVVNQISHSLQPTSNIVELLIVCINFSDFENMDLLPFIAPTAVAEWTRNIIANRLAHNTSTWVEVFQQHNSGTYNNQMMVWEAWPILQDACILQFLIYYLNLKWEVIWATIWSKAKCEIS